MNIEKIKKKNKGFTLVELIIVITILAILATIAFVSFQGHTKESRDTVRLADLTNIDKGLELYNIKNLSLPMPDNYVTIKADGEVIGYQGDIGTTVSRIIGLTGGKDPLDSSFYTYRISEDKKSYQLLGLGETSNNNLAVLNTYASSNNSSRYPITKGSELGIILNKNKVPLQQFMTGFLDIATATGQYIGVKKTNDIIEGTGVVLKEINPDHFLKSLGGKGADIGQHLLQDKDGNIYIGGYFTNDVNDSNKVTDFEGNSLIGKGTSKLGNLFIIKLNSNLKQEWVKVAGGNGTIVMSKLLLDGNGNIYIGGYYSNDIGNNNKIKDFNGGDLKGVTNSITYDTFITKLDNNGNQQWIKTSGGTSSDSLASNIGIDGNGNVYTSGVFYNDKSNSNPTSFKDYGGDNIIGVTDNTGSGDIYVTKLNSSDGNKLWTKTLGSNKVDKTNQIYVSSNGDVYVSGTFSDDSYNNNKSKDFNGNVLYGRHTNASDQGFVAKLNTNGNQTYINVFGGNWGSSLPNITIDGNGNVYVLGSYYNDINNNLGVKDFAGNALPGKSRILDPTISGKSSYSSFVAKLNSSLEQQWIKAMGGDKNDWAEQIYIDGGQNIYVAGRYTNDIGNTNNVVDFAGNTMTGFTNDPAFLNVFLSKLSTIDGTQQWIKKTGSSLSMPSNFISSLVSDKDFNVYVRGSFSTSSGIKDFLGNLVKIGASSSSTDGYLAKISSNGDQVFFKTVSGKGVDIIDGFAINDSSDLLLLGRYHNDFDDVNLARDVLGYRLIGKSDSKAISGTPDIYLQKILYKDLNK